MATILKPVALDSVPEKKPIKNLALDRVSPPRERARWTSHRKLRRCKRLKNTLDRVEILNKVDGRCVNSRTPKPTSRHVHGTDSLASDLFKGLVTIPGERKKFSPISSGVNSMENSLNKEPFREKNSNYNLFANKNHPSNSNEINLDPIENSYVNKNFTNTNNLANQSQQVARKKGNSSDTRSSIGSSLKADHLMAEPSILKCEITHQHHNHHHEKSISKVRSLNNKSRAMSSPNFWWLLILVGAACVQHDLAATRGFDQLSPVSFAHGSLIIGDSAIEIQEVDPDLGGSGPQMGSGEPMSKPVTSGSELLFGSSNGNLGPVGSLELQLAREIESVTRMAADHSKARPSSSSMPGPLPPLKSHDGADGEAKSSDGRNFEANHDRPISDVFSADKSPSSEEKSIAGKVVDFELTPAGGHNKAKIKKKKMKKQKKEEEMFKKWGKKKHSEKKAEEKRHKEGMKKKKEEEKKGKKKWGKEEHGMKKKGKFKKGKWGKKVKKGKGIKKGKKGKKFLKDVGHKDTGFKTVYHREEWGGSKKWHDIKRSKQWDEKSKKWKKKWNKEKGKKYKGDHMKKFEKKKKSGKKYKKESNDKYKKFKKEKFEKGKKMKKEEKMKKKEGGAKKMMKQAKKKKKQH